MAISSIMLSCFIFSFLFFSIFTPTSSSNATDLQALLALKAYIDLDPFGTLESWNDTTPFCSWNGILCGRLHGDRVVAINLMSKGLMGSLSPHLGNLSFLRRIDITGNNFHGQIPQEISLLRQLQYADFSNNSFFGPIPRNLSQCSNLVFLNFGGNNLTGTIPPELGSLHKLKYLSLLKSTLSGSIPPSIGNLTSLTKLTLSTCGLSGEIPESLSQLKSLIYLNLGVNSFTGRIPSSLFNISSMDSFAVHSNQLQGIIPSDIGLTLPNLRELYLGGNQFSGVVPITLSNASLLEVIVLIYNKFTGPMPKVGSLYNLITFTIAVNHIQDDITSFITSMTNCSKLSLFEIGDNDLHGWLPDSIANLSRQIDSIAIQNTQIYGRIPLDIGNLVGLTRLGLSGNNLDGPIPQTIGKLHNMQDIDLSDNRFINEIPSSIMNWTMLLHLWFYGNRFSGHIPQTLINCTNLLELDLSNNNLWGQIPKQISSLSSSISINLSRNIFAGAIPVEIGSLTNLVNFDLSYNRILGPIPDSIKSCQSLELLHLEGNFLQGEIPQGLSSLRSLQDLDLSANNLSGPIPSFLGEFTYLQNLNLSVNKLQGEVPTQGVFRNSRAISLYGNRELCGGIPQLNLPPCPPSPSHHSNKNLSSILMKILIPTVGLIICCALIIFLFRRRIFRKKDEFSLLSSNGLQFLRLTYKHLHQATNGFSESNMIGAGRFGSVYKGILDDGQTLVAVKVLNLDVSGASKTFTAECNALRGIRHRNLLKLLSICASIDFQGNDFKALVYEFKANGSLEKWLHNGNEQDGDENTRNLSFIQRINIAIDVAQALEYLHSGTDSTIVHGDLKPSNILLDNEMTAFVGDFGLAKIISGTESTQESSCSMLKGTIGYIPPEYATSHFVSTQGDVYSFGILLLEMFTNKRPTNEEFSDDLNLHNFVISALQNDVAMEIVDSSIRMQHDVNNKMREIVTCVFNIAVACSKTLPTDRMPMTDVVNDLHKLRVSYLSQN